MMMMMISDNDIQVIGNKLHRLADEHFNTS